MRFTNRLHVAKESDALVLSKLGRLIVHDREQKARLLIYLSEVGKRKLYAKAGYGSLFRFLTEKHGMSESSALKRIQAAKLATKFPFLFQNIADGVFTLSALSRLAPFVNGRNAHVLFGRCQKKSVREVEAILVEYFPKEEVQDRLRKTVSHLGVDRVQIQFTADKAFADDLEKVTALLSHRYPQGRMKDVLGLALRTLKRELEKEFMGTHRARLGASVARDMAFDSKALVPTIVDAGVAPVHATQTGPCIPRGMENMLPVPGSPKTSGQSWLAGSPKTSSQSRHIPRGIRREVWRRDGGRCQFKRPDGSICGEMRFLEDDHIQPWALGGGHQKENIRLLCWTHNQLRSEMTFGKRWVAQKMS